MEFIFFLLFGGAAYLSFYLPGKLVLSRTFHFSSNVISFLSWPVGIGLFLLGIYISGWIHLSYLYIGVIVAITIFAFFREKSLFSISVKTDDLVSWGIILVGSLVFLSLTAFSYLQTKEGLQFIGSINVMDGLLHLAYTKGLLATFPPNHAGLANIPLRGYHYFYDLLMSRFMMFYHFRPEDLYYRYLPLFISLIYGGGFYLLTSKLTSNKLSQRLVLFFAYFAQSFAYVLSFFIHAVNPTAELGSIYPLELILNPAIILSIGMLLCFMYLLFETKPKLWQMILVGFLFGIITELKVYTGIIGVSIFAVVVFYRIIKKREGVFPYFLGLLTMGIIILITYVPNNFGAGSLWFSPFFAYSVFMQEPPFTSWNWEIQRIIFRDHHNIPHLMLLYGQAIGLFWLLSLGSRIVFIFGLPISFKKSFWKEEKNIAVFAMIGVPILVGSFFVQSISIFDTKQFFWIAGCLIAIPSGIALGSILEKRQLIWKTVVIGFVVFLSFGGIWGQLQGFVIGPQKMYISRSEQIFFQKITQKLPKNAVVTYLPQKDATQVMSYPFSAAPVVAVLTGRPTYYEPESAQFDLKTIYADRKKTLLSLQQSIFICNKKAVKQLFAKTAGSVLITMQNTCLDSLQGEKIYAQDKLAAYFIDK